MVKLPGWTGRAARTAVVVTITLLAGLVLCYAALRLVGEERKAGCIADAEARFPVVVVPSSRGSFGLANDGPWTGKANVINEGRRKRALDTCEASVF